MARSPTDHARLAWRKRIPIQTNFQRIFHRSVIRYRFLALREDICRIQALISDFVVHQVNGRIHLATGLIFDARPSDQGRILFSYYDMITTGVSLYPANGKTQIQYPQANNIFLVKEHLTTSSAGSYRPMEG